MAVHPLVIGLLLLSFAWAGCSDLEGNEATDSSSTSSLPAATTTPPPTAADSSSSSSSTAPPAPRPAKTFELNIQGNDFVDGSITIQKGDTVRWTQKDSNQHTVTADDASFDSGTMLPVGTNTFTHKFDASGTFGYHCEIHTSMKDTITVVDALPA